MKKLLLLVCCTVLTASLWGQSSETIQSVRTEFGTQYTLNGKRLNRNKLVELVEKNPESLPYIRKSGTNYLLGYTTGFAGGFMVGWSIGEAIGGQNINWLLTGVGVGLIGISIPFNTASARNTRKAVEAYNSGIKASSNATVQLGITDSGVGISIRF